MIWRSIMYFVAQINRINSYTFDQWAGPSSFFSGASFIKSSILKIVIAASVANLMELIFEIIGSRTPAFKLFRGHPFVKSKPQYFSSSLFGSVSPSFCEAAWRVLNLEISSVASLAAFTAKVLGITFNASLNSEMAICSLVLKDLQNESRWILRAVSTAPPPATTLPDYKVLLATQIQSWRDLYSFRFTFRLHLTWIHWLLSEW